MLEQAIRDFLMLFVTIDPIATLALFVSLTAALSPAERRRVAIRSVVVAGLVLGAFLVGGQVLLSGLGIRLVSFQLAGGVILFLFGLQMIFGTGVAAHSETPEPDHDIAIFPLALPSMATPGAITAIVVLTDNHRQSIAQQTLTGGVLVVVLFLTLVMMLAAQPIQRVIGRTGAKVMVRVLGIILASLAAEQVIAAIERLT
jgi:multiple antibiotic resistance protein